VTNEAVINAVNQIALNEEQQVMLPSHETQEEAQEDTQVQVEAQEDTQEATQSETQPETQSETQADAQEETEGDTVSEEIQEANIAEEELEGTIPEDVTRTRSGRAVVRPSRFMGVTKVVHEDWKSKANKRR
jgi:hypothetical protein